MLPTIHFTEPAKRVEVGLSRCFENNVNDQFCGTLNPPQHPSLQDYPQWWQSQTFVVDAYGHVSVRNPTNASTFFSVRNVAPTLVAGATDVVEYLVEDASAILPNSPTGYVERYIHSEIYKRWPIVNSVIYNHSDVVIPFGVVKFPLQPIAQFGSVFGQNVPIPIFDAADYSSPTDLHILLVNNQHLGAALATYFGSNTTTSSTTPVNNVALMRGHGMTAIGPDIVTTVFRAVCIQNNANDQKDTIGLAAEGNPQGRPGGGGGPIQYLTNQELNAYIAFGTGFYARAWELWVRQAEAAANKAIYNNTIGSPL